MHFDYNILPYPTRLTPLRSPVHLTNYELNYDHEDTLNLQDTIYLRLDVECWRKHNNHEKSKTTVWKIDGWKNTRNETNHKTLTDPTIHYAALILSFVLRSYISLSANPPTQKPNRARDTSTLEDTQTQAERKARHELMKTPSVSRETARQSEGYRESVERERDGMRDAKRRRVSYSLH